MRNEIGPKEWTRATRSGISRFDLTAHSSSRRSLFAAGIAGFVIALMHGKASDFVYDAHLYWGGARALVSGGDFYSAGWLSVRGALSTVIYSPAATASNIFDSGGSLFVLMQNAFLIAVIGVVIVPGIAKGFLTIGSKHIWVSTLLTSLLLSGFTPYPLMDLWAVALLLLGVLLVLRTGVWSLVLGGSALGAAANLRPAYLAPVALAALVWVIFHWKKVHWPAVGAAITFLPQVVVNLAFAASWKPWPVSAFTVANVQSQYASYVVRYDTVAFAGAINPRQFFCSPDSASAVITDVPTTTGELALSFINNFPTSIRFITEKVAASLHWSFATPYADPPSAGLSVMTLFVLFISSVGVMALVWRLVHERIPMRRVSILVLLSVWAGSVATIGFATPETRFALPVVLVGLVGLLAIPTDRPRSMLKPSGIAWGASALLLAALLLWAGFAGLAHPAPPGLVTAAICQVVR